MSGSQTPSNRLSKWSTTSPSKQGPLKATLPISEVLKSASNNTNNPSSLSLSPEYKIKVSFDHTLGQRSPGSSQKAKTSYLVGSADSIRRTASLDTLYLKGQWPRDIYGFTGTIQVDKTTQTDDSDWSDPRKIQSILESEEKSTHSMTFRQKSRSGSRHISPEPNMLNTSSQTLSSYLLSPTQRVSPINVPTFKTGSPTLPKTSIRNSVEALNQEIERIVLRTGSIGEACGSSDSRSVQMTPEGRRPPLLEILKNNRSKSVNTQTPDGFCSDSSHSSGGSLGSSPDDTEPARLGSSPQLNKFLAREPPDGCEKVPLKSMDENPSNLIQLQPSNTFKLRPSLGSAFKRLHPDLDKDDMTSTVTEQVSTSSSSNN